LFFYWGLKDLIELVKEGLLGVAKSDTAGLSIRTEYKYYRQTNYTELGFR
jgi:hypothetical protein